jgi:hypothetical protein
MIRHKVSGGLAGLHVVDFQAVGFPEALRRVTVFKGVPEPAMLGLWIAYLLGTTWLVLAGFIGSSPVNRRDILR